MGVSPRRGERTESTVPGGSFRIPRWIEYGAGTYLWRMKSESASRSMSGRNSGCVRNVLISLPNAKESPSHP
jgi:hypothetical protein